VRHQVNQDLFVGPSRCPMGWHNRRCGSHSGDAFLSTASVGLPTSQVRHSRADCGVRRTLLVAGPCFDPRMHKVVIGALVREGHVLLVHRSQNKRAYPNVWDLPGGLVEAGESELDALARELHEELGLQIATGSASHLCRVTTEPPEEAALLSAWLVREWQGTPANLAPEEHDDIGWFGLQELPPPAHVLVRAALVNAMRSHSA